MPLYVAQILVVVEEIWFSEINDDVIRREEAGRYVHCLLFAAPDREAAYVQASGMIGCMNDANCDGLGDQTHYTGLGIYQLEEVISDRETMLSDINEDNGCWLATIDFDQIPPIARPREELDVFKHPR